MRRRHLLPENEEANSMSAMIDVVFLLLIFFLVTMSGYVETTLLEAALPAAGNGTPADLAQVVRVVITTDPAVEREIKLEVNGNPLDKAAFTQLLRRYQRLQPDAEFIIRSVPDAPHRDLVEVLSLCSRHNLKNLKLAQ